MKNKAKIRVIVAYSVKPNGSRSFESRVTQGKAIATKSFSIGVKRDEDQAYVEAVAAAKTFAKQYRVTPTIRTKEDLLTPQSGRTAASGKPESNPLVDKFGHAGMFRALIKHAMKVHGAEKVKEILEAGLEHVQVAVAELERDRRVMADANKSIAQAIIKARDAGVPMQAPNSDIDAWIEVLLSQELRKDKRPTETKRSGIFELNGERWDGVGHMPASFVKYLKEVDTNDIEDLRVGRVSA